jgi:CBS-domain-containing membrane protein
MAAAYFLSLLFSLFYGYAAARKRRELFSRYNLQAIPVVDSENRIKRIVTKEEVGSDAWGTY